MPRPIQWLALTLLLSACGMDQSHEPPRVLVRKDAGPGEQGPQPGIGLVTQGPESGQSRETLVSYLIPERDEWNRPERVIETMAIKPGMAIADVGAGSGYLTFRLARATGPRGVVYAPDVDPLAISMLAERLPKEWDSATMGEIKPYLSPFHDSLLPWDTVDRAILIDVHFYVEDPLSTMGRECLANLHRSMRPRGMVHVIESHAEDQNAPEDPQRLARIVANFTTAGFQEVGQHDFVDKHFYIVFSRP